MILNIISYYLMSFYQNNDDTIVLQKKIKQPGSAGYVMPTHGVKVKKMYDNPDDKSEEPDILPVMTDQKFGQMIQTARTAKKMTQKELANALNIPVSIISDYEKGSAIHNSIYVGKIKTYLGIKKEH